MHQDYEKHKMLYFIGTFAIIFLLSFIIFSFSGLAPAGLRLGDYIDLDITKFVVDKSDYYKSQLLGIDTYTRPDRIIIDKIGVDAVVNKPNTYDVAELDKYLSSGAVHYPSSGSVESGNMFIFGHSTGFQVVQNQAYKTFNDLNKLVVGDIINIEASGEIYSYKVTKVTLVDEDEALVRFDKDSRRLTLSTCNSFGAKQERWVVEADFVE